MAPRFTFCIPNLNKIEFLPACIDSMLAQDSDDWCCVFVDGFSTDGCWEYMQRFADDPRFRLLRGLKQGMYADWNYCLDQVESEYFYILTSDDTCYPQLVSCTTSTLDQYDDVDACHFQYALIDHDGEILQSPAECIAARYPIYSKVNQYAHRRSGICESFMHYAYGTIYTTLTSLVFRKRLLGKIQHFSTNYGPVGDFDWTMRIGWFTDVIYLPMLLATWRIYPGQATATNIAQDAVENYFKIAQKNVDSLESLYSKGSKRLSFKKKMILSKLQDSCISGRLHLVKERSISGNTISELRHVLSLDFLYPVRKVLRHASKNRLYAYDVTKFAQMLIEVHQLDWPPPSILVDYLSQMKYEPEVSRL